MKEANSFVGRIGSVKPLKWKWLLSGRKQSYWQTKL